MICRPLKQPSYHYVAVKQFEIEKIWFSELKENISSFAKAVGPQNIVENIGVYYTTYPNQPQERIMALICTPVMDCSLVQVYDC
uniref:Uncharacterized protein n=1 Tax=Acrobeloides nanus TaxID=290746 RepID=A0A914CFG4_9BILA